MPGTSGDFSRSLWSACLVTCVTLRTIHVIRRASAGLREILFAADMLLVYFINKPNPIALAEDGKIHFLPFGMIPDSIIVNGFEGLVGNNGLSVIPIKELVNLGYLQPNAGTPSDPLRVEGNLLTGKQYKII